MELKELRSRLDTVDEKLTGLFVERMGIAKEIAKEKEKKGLTVLNRGREREVLSRVSDIAGEELAPYTRTLYSTLFDLSRSYQEVTLGSHSELGGRIRTAMENTPKVFPAEAIVACQGVEGANSQIATDRLFRFARITYVRNFEGVFNAVEKGLCRYGVLPIENSSHGSVNAVYDLMGTHKFSIVRGIKVHIKHVLLAKAGVDFSDIKEIFSHEQAIGQCSRYLASLPGVKVTVCENTAAAAKMVSESDRTDVAAISSEDCAAIYGLSVVRREIQDTDNNYTRFIVISKNLEIYPGSDKISIMFEVSNTPGALQRLISRFSAQSLNMTKLESRPISGTDFQYRFYVDVEADVADPAVADLLCELENDIEGFVYLGSYKEI